MPKILVVEDSKSIREDICEILEFEGFDVIWAENGESGLKKAKTALPNLILSDISMPKLNGYQFLDQLKKSNTTELIPFIFLTGKNELPDLRKGMNMGADDYLVKPVNINELTKVVKSKLKKQQVIQDNIDELVEENEYSLKEAGRMAKIGYWRYIKKTDSHIWSDAIHKIYGTDPTKGVPKLDVFLSFFNDESRNKLTEAIMMLDTDGVPFDIELQIINLKNEERWIRSIGENLYNTKNEIIGRRGVSQDITEQKLIRNKIEKAQKMYRVLANNSSDLICLNELDSTFVYVSPSLKTLLGYDQSDLINRVVFDFIHNDDINSLKDTIQEKMFDLLKDEKKEKEINKAVNNPATYRVRHKEGHYIWFEFLISPVYENEKISHFITAGRDISQRVLAKQKIQNALKLLEKKEYSLRESSKMAKIGYFENDIKTGAYIWSDQVYHIFGLDPKNPVPPHEKLLELLDEESRKKVDQANFDHDTKGIPYDIEFKLINFKKKETWIRLMSQPIYNKQNKIIGRRGVGQDITEQKLTRTKIEKAEEMYRILTDHSNDIICMHETDGTFKYISPSVKNILGYEQSEYLGKKIFDLVHEDDTKSIKEVMHKRLFNNELSKPFSYRVLHKKGHFVWLEFFSSPVYKDNKLSHFVTYSRDITQWMLAKEEIQEYQTSLQKLTTEITLIEEKQKKEIASNIHDHLSQSLVISKMRINELKKKPLQKGIVEDLKFIEKNISDALKNSRKITYDLSPPVLYQLGIIDALNWLVEEVETTHKIKCIINSNVTTLILDDVKSILLYRSIQEVINNAVKYSNASHITLNINKNKLGLDILLNDNGTGFDTSTLNTHNHTGSGFGLFTVRERIRNIKGEFRIASEINKGTHVTFFIPLSI